MQVGIDSFAAAFDENSRALTNSPWAVRSACAALVPANASETPIRIDRHLVIGS